MEWMFLPLRRYVDFSGRSRRKEYWMFKLGTLLLIVLLAMLYGEFETAALVIGSLCFLALILPSLAVEVRRFHDQNRRGWFVLLNLIPYLGGLIVLALMCLDGTHGPNRFGPDPKMRTE